MEGNLWMKLVSTFGNQPSQMRTHHLHRSDPCTIFAAEVGFSSALLWSDSLIGKTTNDIPAGSAYASNLQMPGLYSLPRGHRLRNGIDDSRRVGAKQRRRAFRAEAANRLQTPDRADLRAQLLPVPRREDGDGRAASRRQRVRAERRTLRRGDHSRRQQTEFAREANPRPRQ